MKQTIITFTPLRENVTGCHEAAMTELPMIDRVRTVQLERWRRRLGQPGQLGQP